MKMAGGSTSDRDMAMAEVSNLENLEDMEEDEVDSPYFTSYEDIDVHTLMLKDRPRTLAYKNFVEKNKDMFKNKIVIDVGAGSGILSLFAAKAGAKKVYAIEASNMSVMCEAIVKRNNFQGQIEVIHGRVEEVQLPEETQADVIISEWMGFYLLHESMLNSVIVARDKWLSPDGIMVPSAASLYVSPINMKNFVKENHDCWSDMYGFDLSPIMPAVKVKSLTQPTITDIEPKQCLAIPELLANLELKYVTADDIKNIIGSFNFQITQNSLLHAFACWFDTEFEGDSELVKLGTGPKDPKTHWQQTVIFLPQALLVSKDDVVKCEMQLTQDDENPRRYNISVELDEYADECEEDDEDDNVYCIPVDDEAQLPEGLKVVSGSDLKEMLLKSMDKPAGGACGDNPE